MIPHAWVRAQQQHQQQVFLGRHGCVGTTMDGNITNV